MPPAYDTEEARIIRDFRSLVANHPIPSPRFTITYVPNEPNRFIVQIVGAHVPPPAVILKTTVPAGYSPISLNEIDRQIQQSYPDRVLHLILTEDPVEGAGYTTVFGRDQQANSVEVKILDLPQNEAFRRKLAFGTHLGVLNPTYWFTPQWRGVMTEHVEVIHVGKRRHMCRYCFKEKATKQCYFCQARYCNFYCLKHDWNDFNHRWICQSDYFRYLNYIAAY